MVDEEVPGRCVGSSDQEIELATELYAVMHRHDLQTHSENCIERQHALIVLAAVRIHHLWASGAVL